MWPSHSSPELGPWTATGQRGWHSRRECRYAYAENGVDSQLFKSFVSDRMPVPRLKGLRTPERSVPVGTGAAEANTYDISGSHPHEGPHDIVRAMILIWTEPPFVYGLVISFFNVIDGRGDILPGKHKGFDNVSHLVLEAGCVELGLVVFPVGTNGSEITGDLGGDTGIEVGEEIWWLDRVPSSTGSS